MAGIPFHKFMSLLTVTVGNLMNKCANRPEYVRGSNSLRALQMLYNVMNNGEFLRLIEQDKPPKYDDVKQAAQAIEAEKKGNPLFFTKVVFYEDKSWLYGLQGYRSSINEMEQKEALKLMTK